MMEGGRKERRVGGTVRGRGGGGVCLCVCAGEGGRRGCRRGEGGRRECDK